jgi:hypothetical protein
MFSAAVNGAENEQEAPVGRYLRLAQAREARHEENLGADVDVFALEELSAKLSRWARRFMAPLSLRPVLAAAGTLTRRAWALRVCGVRYGAETDRSSDYRAASSSACACRRVLVRTHTGEGLTAADLARVQQTEPFLFLLNGWNELQSRIPHRRTTHSGNLNRIFRARASSSQPARTT